MKQELLVGVGGKGKRERKQAVRWGGNGAGKGECKKRYRRQNREKGGKKKEGKFLLKNGDGNELARTFIWGK